MNIFSKFLFAGLALLLCVSSASAAIYNWSFNNWDLGVIDYTASGTLTTGGPGVGLNGPGFDIVSITGTSNFGAITGLLVPGSCCGSPPYINNNIFYPSGLPYVDAAGFAYSDAAGDSVEIWTTYVYGFTIETPAGVVSDRGGLTISPVPEPQTYAMWLAGLALIGFVAYRRKNDSSNMLRAA